MKQVCAYEASDGSLHRTEDQLLAREEKILQEKKANAIYEAIVAVFGKHTYRLSTHDVFRNWEALTKRVNQNLSHL